MRGGGTLRGRLGRLGVTITVMVASGALGYGASGAVASTHSATLEWEEPTPPRTLGAPKQPTREDPYLSRVSVSYDDATGNLRTSYAYYEPSQWVVARWPGPPEVLVYLGSSCLGHARELTISTGPV